MLDYTPDEIAQIDWALYGTTGAVMCIDAVHIENNEDCEPRTYTWYIPYGVSYNIEDGDILVVEQTVGIGLAFVQAVGAPYEKTRGQHESDIHPYCRVIKNLGLRKYF